MYSRASNVVHRRLTMQLRGDISGDWQLAPTQAGVVMVALSYQLKVIVRDVSLDELEVTLLSPFTARLGSDDREYRLDPETTDPDLGRFAVALKDQRMIECRCTSTGVLVLRFDGGSSFEAEPSDSDVEAWEVIYSGSKNNQPAFQIVCRSGEDRVIWGPD